MNNIAKQKSILEVLKAANPRLRQSILYNCDDKTICALVEIIHNLLQGRIPLGPNQKKRLQKYKKKFRYLTERCIKKNKHINNKKARKVIIQTGGALPFLIPLILPLIAKAALSGAVAAGAGYATNKVIKAVSK